MRLGTCDVFPIEAVYAYIEVKAQLRSTGDSAERYPGDSIEKCLEKNRDLRGMIERRYWCSQGSPIQLELKTVQGLSLRSFVFSFEGTGKVASNAEQFANRMAAFSQQLGGTTHLHGVYIGDVGYFGTRAVDIRHAVENDYYHVAYTTSNPLRAFKLTLLNALATFDRYPLNWTAAIGQYHLDTMKWATVDPNHGAP